MVRRQSKKRQALYDMLCSVENHPTADWLYEKLKPEYPDLSLATVYRNLRLLCSEGLARSVGVVDGHERFDGCCRDHVHFVCSVCGKVLDVCDCPVPDNNIGAYIGAEVSGFDLTYYGKCRECISPVTT